MMEVFLLLVALGGFAGAGFVGLMNFASKLNDELNDTQNKTGN